MNEDSILANPSKQKASGLTTVSTMKVKQNKTTKSLADRLYLWSSSKAQNESNVMEWVEQMENNWKQKQNPTFCYLVPQKALSKVLHLILPLALHEFYHMLLYSSLFLT